MSSSVKSLSLKPARDNTMVNTEMGWSCGHRANLRQAWHGRAGVLEIGHHQGKEVEGDQRSDGTKRSDSMRAQRVLKAAHDVINMNLGCGDSISESICSHCI